MFNSTHTLVGFALAGTGIGRWTRYATATAVVAANLPDVDILTGLIDGVSYIQYHRGMTHTLAGIPFLALGLAGVMHRVARIRGGPPARFWPLFLIAAISMMTHPMLDYANTYGVRPFAPFEKAWFYGDCLFVFDPFLDLVLLAGVLAGRFFRRRPFAVVSAMAIATAYVGLRVELRDVARGYLAEHTRSRSDIRRLGVSPDIFNPWRWTGLIETEYEFLRVPIDIGTGVGESDLRIDKAPDSDVTRKARQTRAAEVFLEFARFPFSKVEQIDAGYRVVFSDFRFYRREPSAGFAVEVFLDRDLNPLREGFAFDQPVRVASAPASSPSSSRDATR